MSLILFLIVAVCVGAVFLPGEVVQYKATCPRCHRQAKVIISGSADQFEWWTCSCGYTDYHVI